MIKKVLVLFSVLVMLLVIVSCAPKMSDEELEAELNGLSPEELEAVTAEDNGAIAGQATAKLRDPRLVKLKNSYKRSATTCSDTDADAAQPKGKDYFEKGTLTWSGSSVMGVDTCTGVEDELRENYCSGTPKGLRLTEIVNCQKVGQLAFPGSSNWKCLNGACVADTGGPTPNASSDGSEGYVALTLQSPSYSLVQDPLNASLNTIVVTAEVKNDGTASTGVGFKVGFTQLTVLGQPVTNQSMAALAAGETAMVSATLKAHCPSPAGGHSISLYADVDGVVVETSKSDNDGSVSYSC